MRTIIAWMVTISMAAAVWGGHHFNEINVRHMVTQFEYHYRGWLQGWQMQMRMFSPNEMMLLGAVVLVFLWSAVTINK